VNLCILYQKKEWHHTNCLRQNVCQLVKKVNPLPCSDFSHVPALQMKKKYRMHLYNQSSLRTIPVTIMERPSHTTMNKQIHCTKRNWAKRRIKVSTTHSRFYSETSHLLKFNSQEFWCHDNNIITWKGHLLLESYTTKSL